ncbi:MAG TPA: AMP-binding protein, partial [Kofleriaceae bacterium]|nr:AMP-binding protein [Kofleriaceae bacterium]
EVTPADRVLGLSSLSFDLSVYDVFGMLAAGGALVLPGPADAREPARWLAQIGSSRVTLWNTVPALMEMLVDHVIASGSRNRLPLRAVMMSGDWIPINLPARIAEVAPRARSLSLGGATEASIWSISYPIERIDPAWTSVPYGVPMRNQRFEVLDEAMRPRPVWVPGDLYIAGEGLARGYWRDEERTAKSFFFHPFTGERLYRTGDLGRYLPDGNIEFLGRADFQVKIGGYRIELGEIEAAMSQLAGVRNAVAVATGERGARRLLAYVAPDPGASLTEEGILSALRAKIPGYAVPQRVLLLDALPLSSNGKVDRRALPEPGAAHAERSLVAPRNDTERALVDFWRELLGQESIGVVDNFFDLGGQSLLAVRLMGLIQQRWGATLPLATLFEHPTVEALARLVGADAAPGASDRTALVALRSSGSEAPLFFAHPVGGDVLCYADLAAAFEPGQPFYGLQAVDSAEPAGIAEMAAHHVSAIRERQPSGPYRLGGWSMGGVLAYEMAQQLRRAGERVELLALVDVSMSPTGARRDIDDAWLLAAFAHDLAGVSRRALTVDDAHLRTLAPSERMAHVLEQARACGVLPPEIDAATLAVYFERFRRNYRAMLAYQAQQYGGRLLFLRARDGGASPEIARGWGALAAAADVIDVDGDHYAICRRDGARVIAGLLAARLRRAAVSPTPTALEAIRVEPRDTGVLGAQEVPPAMRSSRPGLI